MEPTSFTSTPAQATGTAAAGGASLGAQVLGVDAATAPTGDAGSILANPLRRDGDWIEVDIDTGAGGLDWSGNPATGMVYWDILLKDLLGADLASCNLHGLHMLELQVDALLSADLVVFACTRTAALTASTRAYGAAIIGNGGTVNDAAQTERVGGSWTSTVIAGSAAVRKVRPYQGVHGQTRTRSASVVALQADSTFVNERVTSPTVTFQDTVGVSFGVGADVATANFTGTARFKVLASFLSEAQIRG